MYDLYVQLSTVFGTFRNMLHVACMSCCIEDQHHLCDDKFIFCICMFNYTILLNSMFSIGEKNLLLQFV